ncbi:MAG: insulinase family protein [Sphingomonadaceae bacterium]|nr:insulinase family protein [Sphingomonadaceae bacterium]
MSLRRLLPVLPLLFAVPAFAAEPAPVSALVRAVDIPYQSFTLPNGLRVLVHTDRKAPVVAVSIWYHVGSKDELKGKTGFAHLFEHLMFNGSENSPGDFFEPLQQIGATDLNGTTWFDRTNYFETVPTGALDRALFLESDRMGHLLGGIDQAKLNNQRGVVQNEKRQGDNAPFGTVDYTVYATLFPEGHPYRHETIGSMADLNGASLEDVKNWFRAKYGPDNAVLVLAGDIDLPTAKAKVAKWFGDIPRGPAITRVSATIPTLAAPVTKVFHDQVPFTRVMRMWAVEGVNGRDNTALEVAASVLGGLSSSRLDNALVRGDHSAVAVSASAQAFEQIGVLTVSADVRPGQDAAAVGAKMDAVIATFLKDGPTADEVRRVATRSIAATIGGYESVGGFGGKAVALAEGLVYSGDPAKYKKDLAELAALTPAEVQAAARKWMSRPVFNLTVEPGPRDASPAALAVTGDAVGPQGRGPSFYRKPGAPEPAPREAVDRSHLPDVGTLTALVFPAIERTELSNGIKVYFARRTSVPVVRVAVSFDAGYSADPRTALGTQSLALALLDEGTTTRSSVQIAEEQERLGATISAGASIDRSTVGLFALTPNLAPSLALLADVVRNPAFAPAEVERVRGQQLSRIAAQLSEPGDVARYMLNPRLYGPAHPYGVPGTGTGEAAAVAKLTRDDLVRFHHDWFWPGNAQIFVVGDTTMADLKPLLEASFGNWAADRMARPRKDLTAAILAPVSKIYLVDRPGSGQSVIRGGLVLAATGHDDLITLNQANDVLGGQFLSRLNLDLRETKGWSYGVGSVLGQYEGRVPFVVVAPVQADRTGESLSALIADLKSYTTTQGTTLAELERTINGAVRELPGTFETAEAVLDGVQKIVWLGRPDDYYERLPARYRALTTADLDRAARSAINPSRMMWVVVGDAATIRPQLDKVGLPIEVVAPPAK